MESSSKDKMIIINLFFLCCFFTHWRLCPDYDGLQKVIKQHGRYVKVPNVEDKVHLLTNQVLHGRIQRLMNFHLLLQEQAPLCFILQQRCVKKNIIEDGRKGPPEKQTSLSRSSNHSIWGWGIGWETLEEDNKVQCVKIPRVSWLFSAVRNKYY